MVILIDCAFIELKSPSDQPRDQLVLQTQSLFSYSSDSSASEGVHVGLLMTDMFCILYRCVKQALLITFSRDIERIYTDAAVVIYYH
jgi:hypothetical protein